MANQRKIALAAGSKTRIVGVATEQTVKATPGILHRIVLTNSAAAVGSLTVTDGAANLIVAEILPDTTTTLHFEVEFDTNIKVTPSATTMDCLIIFD